MTQVIIANSTQRLFTVVKRNILGVVIGSVIGGITFYPLSMPVSLTIFLNMENMSFENLVMVGKLFWFIPLIGVIIGGLVGGHIGKCKSLFVPLNNNPLLIIFWLVAILGVLGLESGFMVSGVILLFDWGGVDYYVGFLTSSAFSFLRDISFALNLGNTSTTISPWIFSGVGAIVGVIIGALIGSLFVLIRFAIVKFRASNNR